MSNDLSSLKASIDMALNAISQVEADVSVLKAQVEEIDGDYPCMIPGIPGGGGGGGSIWSGIVFANGQPIKDFNRIGNDPEEANSEFGLYGMDGDVYAGSVTGEWLKVDRATGDCDFMDSDDEELFDDASDHEYFKVAERSGKDENGDWIYFPVSLRTCGDAHVFKGGALDVAGTPAMYKVVIILGWKKTSAEASWEQMTAEEVVSNPPTKLWDEFIPYDEETKEGDEYPWYAFRPTWDYPRTHA